jgi:hypothetical protein
VPSPYAHSLKPTLIVPGIVVTDIRFDLFQRNAHRGDRLTTRPKVLARAMALMAPTLAGAGHRPLALAKPKDRGHGMLGRARAAQRPMLWPHLSLDEAACLWAGQRMKDWPQWTTHRPKPLLPAPCGHQDNRGLAMPACMRQALREL